MTKKWLISIANDLYLDGVSKGPDHHLVCSDEICTNTLFGFYFDKPVFLQFDASTAPFIEEIKAALIAAVG